MRLEFTQDYDGEYSVKPISKGAKGDFTNTVGRKLVSMGVAVEIVEERKEGQIVAVSKSYIPDEIVEIELPRAVDTTIMNEQLIHRPKRKKGFWEKIKAIWQVQE
jgi:hypothetical protein